MARLNRESNCTGPHNVRPRSSRRSQPKFYRAFESLDLENMEKVWLKDRQIVCIHPGWRKLSGWGPVMESWERIFDGVFEMSFELGDVDVIMTGDLAVLIVEENLTQPATTAP